MFSKTHFLFIYFFLAGVPCFAQCFKDKDLFFSLPDATGITQIFSHGYCLESNSKYVTDIDCEKDKPCESLAPRKLPRKLISTADSSENPAYHYCGYFHGKAVSVQYLNGKQRVDSPVCVFPDKSFVSLDFFVLDLLKFY